MLRFAQNRWWAFVLTLSLLITSGAALSPAFGDGGASDILVIGDGGGGSNPSGDPDVPAGPGKTGTGTRHAAPGGYRYAATAVGDGGSAASVWVWRFHVVLRSLIIRYSR